MQDVVLDIAGDNPFLADRYRYVGDGEFVTDGTFVLYWMHHATRGHENPALDIAIEIGNRLNKPVLVYQGLNGRHRYNSDRHHTFILQGARDAAREIEERDVAYKFFLGTDPSVRSPLRNLIDNAAAVIVEDYPAPPFPGWTRRLAADTARQFIAVDTRCIVPMRLHGQFYERAFEFRRALKKEFERRQNSEWSASSPAVQKFDGPLPFTPVDLESSRISELCATCSIDHSIGPVHHTPGGSVAGYSRWNDFKRDSLEHYHNRRNDASIWPPPVSRMSAYLHHGHVSPFRLAREAAATESEGARKYLDEMLVWRELAHNLCFYHDDVETTSVLPNWAIESLAKHIDDARDVKTLDALSNAETGDRLWDLAQTSLLRHGELHNNVRMTWGKALLSWSRNPQEALRRLIDLNHRYALDGSDPNSYGGLLWCMGLFDRPFPPDKPVTGVIRTRSTDNHASRLDMNAYSAIVHRPSSRSLQSIAVIGAGISGLAAARSLALQGYVVKLFDKARGPGGRMATRRADGGFAFDHGAQYFTARDDRFRRYVDDWCEAGIVAEWQGLIGVVDDQGVSPAGAGTARYVGVPGMSALTRHLSRNLNISYSTTVDSVRRDSSGRWRLTSDEGSSLGSFDNLVCTVPPLQAARILRHVPDVIIPETSMMPCWSVMVAFEQSLDLIYDGLFINRGALSWAARNSSKPGRSEGESWVLHSSPEWAQEHLEKDKGFVQRELLNAFFAATGVTPSQTRYLTAHRWRYALADSPLTHEVIWDDSTTLAICGDWVNGSRVEGAFLSGCAAAGHVMGVQTV